MIYFGFALIQTKTREELKSVVVVTLFEPALLQFVGKLHARRGLKEVKQMHENEPGRVQECELAIMHKGKKGVRRWEGGGDGAESCCPCAAQCTCTQNRCFPPHLHAL